ncbi:hypothetical protein [Rhodomicrobium sp.]|uniref:hypothetical protein n=1 Tax=Rhodomicrobium sp. TaxID=2720632 RepID=UPI0039E56363
MISTSTSPAFGPSRSTSTISSGFFGSKATLRVFSIPYPPPVIRPVGFFKDIAQVLANLCRRYRPAEQKDIPNHGTFEVLSGISFLRRIRMVSARLPLLVLSMHLDPVVVARPLQGQSSAVRAILNRGARGSASRARTSSANSDLAGSRILHQSRALLGIGRRNLSLPLTSRHGPSGFRRCRSGRTRWLEYPDQIRVALQIVEKFEHGHRAV